MFCFIRHIAGLNAGRARNIMEWKEKNGPFLNREQLKLVKGLGPKSFQQCAGFIRINPETVPRYTACPCHFYFYMFLHQATFISCRREWDKMCHPLIQKIMHYFSHMTIQYIYKHKGLCIK